MKITTSYDFCCELLRLTHGGVEEMRLTHGGVEEMRLTHGGVEEMLRPVLHHSPDYCFIEPISCYCETRIPFKPVLEGVGRIQFRKQHC